MWESASINNWIASDAIKMIVPEYVLDGLAPPVKKEEKQKRHGKKLRQGKAYFSFNTLILFMQFFIYSIQFSNIILPLHRTSPI